jgi:hypothetical protein
VWKDIQRQGLFSICVEFYIRKIKKLLNVYKLFRPAASVFFIFGLPEGTNRPWCSLVWPDLVVVSRCLWLGMYGGL